MSKPLADTFDWTKPSAQFKVPANARRMRMFFGSAPAKVRCCWTMDSKTGKGVVFAFRGANTVETSHVFKLAGLDRSTSYEIWSEDGSLSRGQATGAKLMDEGLRVQLSDPGASELIYLQVPAARPR